MDALLLVAVVVEVIATESPAVMQELVAELDKHVWQLEASCGG